MIPGRTCISVTAQTSCWNPQLVTNCKAWPRVSKPHCNFGILEHSQMLYAHRLWLSKFRVLGRYITDTQICPIFFTTYDVSRTPYIFLDPNSTLTTAPLRPLISFLKTYPPLSQTPWHQNTDQLDTAPAGNQPFKKIGLGTLLSSTTDFEMAIVRNNFTLAHNQTFTDFKDSHSTFSIIIPHCQPYNPRLDMRIHYRPLCPKNSECSTAGTWKLVIVLSWTSRRLTQNSS